MRSSLDPKLLRDPSPGGTRKFTGTNPELPGLFWDFCRSQGDPSGGELGPLTRFRVVKDFLRAEGIIGYGPWIFKFFIYRLFVGLESESNSNIPTKSRLQEKKIWMYLVTLFYCQTGMSIMDSRGLGPVARAGPCGTSASPGACPAGCTCVRVLNRSARAAAAVFAPKIPQSQYAACWGTWSRILG